ncbi:Pls/PosA family non-ribosomal peptide synthetase, partial [Camelimonas abortus]
MKAAFDEMNQADAGTAASSCLRGPARPDLLRDETLAEIFEESARRRPDHPVWICDGRSWTYAEAEALTAAIARALVARGVGPGAVVGLWAPRGVDLLAAQAAIARTGAAWLPFDADAPVERIAVCLKDAGAAGLVTCEAFAGRAEGPGAACWTIETLRAEGAAGHPAPLPDPRARGLGPDSPAYVIYTSGSTGAPKGIVVSQRNICHFLRAANEVYGVGPDDVVFQGASLAFDLSMEEVWVPYLAGATLHVATPEVMNDIENLPGRLAAAGVTVLDTVPTLLAMLPDDIPSLRVILLGGEALPPALAERWAKPGRRLFNTYGPTEATVVATVAEIVPGRPVTIGRPLPNYTCHVVDEALRPAPPGVTGELLIGGPGVAMGYLGRPELTAEKFIANPFGDAGGEPVLYRSGDAVSLTEDGELAFHGRIDDQVKIRGFRVELGEIEAALCDFPDVAQAAVVVREDSGVERLTAFLVAQPGRTVDRMAIRSSLRDRLPSYMFPAHFETVASLPRLTSGKVDRKALKQLPLRAASETAVQEEPQGEAEAALLAAAQKVFPGETIPFDADFFLDLGGHSLLAARFVSEVRKTPAFASLTMQDVYAARTLRAMAALLEANREDGARDLSFTPPPLARRFWCGVAQALALPLILGMVTIQWLGLFLASIAVVREDAPWWVEMGLLFVIYVALNIGAKLLIAGVKWAVLGRTKPGRYPLWGVYYFRVWFVQRMIQASTLHFLQNSPLMRVYLRLLGARIGRDVVIGDFEAGAIDLISIGDCASIGNKTRFANVAAVGDELVIGTIDIGPDAYIGNACSFGPNCRVGRSAEIADLTAIEENMTVGEAEKWEGSPARKTGMADLAALPPQAQTTPATRALQGVAYGVGYIVMLMLGLLPIFPAFYLLYNLDTLFSGAADHEISWATLPLLALPTALALIVVSMAVIVACRWIILPRRVQPGTHSIHSWFYVRRWLMGLASEVTLETLNSLYATLYMRVWCRLMGAKIGKGSEISTNLAGRYDLVDIGDGNFLGDEVIFGDEEVRRGYMTLKRVKTGDRVFFGNDAIVPGGSVVENDALLGVKSRMPESLHVGAGETWFGSPAIRLPVRQKFSAAASFTYQPPRRMLVLRALFEAFHTSLPTALFITCGYMTADVIAGPLDEGAWLAALGVFLAAGVAIAMALVAFSAAVKWLMMGVYRPCAHPMWSWWAMRTEAVAVIYSGLVGKASLEFFRGTPFLPWLLRLYGVKTGRGVWMDWADITEFDCVTIGDYCVINMGAALQTHLYEDRIMKVGRIELGRGVTVGAGSTVLYDTHVGDFARIGQTTVIMKGETVPAHSEWTGAPAQPLRRAR